MSNPMSDKPGNPFNSPYFRGVQKVYVQGKEVTGSFTKREAILVDAIAAMRDFCSAVEAGTIASKRTYARFKRILERYDAL